MCGYLIYQDKPSVQELRKHLDVNKHRGTDGYGVMNPVTGESYSELRLNKFLDRWDKFYSDSGYIVHHRKASIGGVSSDLVHPLIHNDVKVMQNGTRRELSQLFYAKSDSLALAEIWTGLSDDLVYLILEGCGVVFIYDRDTLYFHKDEQRTLYFNKKRNVYASEPVFEGHWDSVEDVCLGKLDGDVASWEMNTAGTSEFWKPWNNRVTLGGKGLASAKRSPTFSSAQTVPSSPPIISNHFGRTL